MRLTWITRPLLAFLLLAAVLITISGILELTSAIRQATGSTMVEANLVTGGVQREMNRLATVYPPDSLAALGRDPRLREALMEGVTLAPSILHVAVLAPSGVAVAHTMPDYVGTVAQAHPSLPAVDTFWKSLRGLWNLRRGPKVFQVETPLLCDNAPFATIQVVLASSFLQEAVKDAASRGMRAAAIVISVALVSSVLLTRMATNRIRSLSAGVAAIREGRFTEKIPVSGIDEFGLLARELNLLSEYFERERKKPPAQTGGGAAGDHTLDPAWVNARVLTRLGETATGVAHELRNQLQTVHFALERLRCADGGDPDEIRCQVDAVAQGVDGLDGAIRAFLRIARMRALSQEPVSVNMLLEQILGELRPEALLAGATLGLELDPGIPDTLADREVLRQAVHNLVRNALQAFGEAPGEVVVASGISGQRISITVSDDGPGIPPEVLGQVFELYFTTKKDGTGVGLALVRQAAELHGGEVAIETETGRGTRVRIEIPYVPVDEAVASRTNAESARHA